MPRDGQKKKALSGFLFLLSVTLFSEADRVVANDSQVVSNAVREGITVLQTPPHYYYHPTTDTKADETKGSPKTFDAGVGIYAVTAVLSVTGMAWVGKKRH